MFDLTEVLRAVTVIDTRPFILWYMDGNNIRMLSAVFAFMRKWRLLHKHRILTVLDRYIHADITGVCARVKL
jgi:hypothetical protein